MRKYFLVDIRDTLFLDENLERCNLICFLNVNIRNLYEQRYYFSHLKNGYLKDITKISEIDELIKNEIEEMHIPNKIVFSLESTDSLEGITYIYEPYSNMIFKTDDVLVNFTKVGFLTANKHVLSYSTEEIEALEKYLKNISFSYSYEEDEEYKKAKIIKFYNKNKI